MVFYLNNDILELIGIYYKKNKYWNISQPYRNYKEWWIKKFYFDQLFKKYIGRFDGIIYEKEYRPIVNNGNHFTLYIHPNYDEIKNIKQLDKLKIINNRYRLLNNIILFNNLKPSKIKNALIDKRHYLDVEEYIDCILYGILSDIPYIEYKSHCFNGKNCEHCNRIQNYSNKFLCIEDLWYMV